MQKQMKHTGILKYTNKWKSKKMHIVIINNLCHSYYTRANMVTANRLVQVKDSRAKGLSFNHSLVKVGQMKRAKNDMRKSKCTASCFPATVRKTIFTPKRKKNICTTYPALCI